MSTHPSWAHVLSEMPLIAILRGIEPREAVAVAEALYAAGFRCVEVPLNSRDALHSIEKIRSQLDELLVGAGTVLCTAEVAGAHAAGAEFIVSPNTNAGVIGTTKARDLISVPGVLTPTEAFIALDAGADALKFFPAEMASPAALRALKAVIPAKTPVLPVGGITASGMKAWVDAGAAAFGIGSALYAAGMDVLTVKERATAFVKEWQQCRS